MNIFWSSNKLERFTDAILLGLAIMFAIFFVQSALHPEISSSSGALAHFVNGEMSRKRAGGTGFSPVKYGDDLYNRDLLLVDSGKTAVIQFGDGKILELEENTLLILRRSTRGVEAPVIKVMRGGVISLMSTDKKVFDEKSLGKPKDKTKPSPTPTPSAEPVPSPPPEPPHEEGKEPAPETTEAPEPKPSVSVKPFEKQLSKEAKNFSMLHPMPDTAFAMIHGSTASIAFSWNKKISGTLVIHVKDGPEILRNSLVISNSSLVNLKAEVAYTWEILDSQGVSITGVQQFSIMNMTNKPIKEVMKAQMKTKGSTVEILY